MLTLIINIIFKMHTYIQLQNLFFLVKLPLVIFHDNQYIKMHHYSFKQSSFFRSV